MSEKKQIEKILEEAAALIEKGWNQGCYAMDSLGTPVSTTNQMATSFCLMGALKRASCGTGISEFVISKVAENLNPTWKGRLGEYNDKKTRTKKQVLKLLQRTKENLNVTK